MEAAQEQESNALSRFHSLSFSFLFSTVGWLPPRGIEEKAPSSLWFWLTALKTQVLRIVSSLPRIRLKLLDEVSPFAWRL